MRLLAASERATARGEAINRLCQSVANRNNLIMLLNGSVIWRQARQATRGSKINVSDFLNHALVCDRPASNLSVTHHRLSRR